MKKFLNSILAIIMGGIFMTAPLVASAPVFAECADGQVQTSILGENGCADASEDSIKNMVKHVADFLSIGVGVLGTIGVTIVGIQYLTAGGNEEQTRKAKRRLLEIVIGMAAYFLMYGILNWLGVIK